MSDIRKYGRSYVRYNWRSFGSSSNRRITRFSNVINARTVKIFVDRDIFPFIKKSPNRRSKNGWQRKGSAKKKKIQLSLEEWTVNFVVYFLYCDDVLSHSLMTALWLNETKLLVRNSKTVYVEINALNYTIYYNIIYKEVELVIVSGSKEQLENFNCVSWSTWRCKPI